MLFLIFLFFIKLNKNYVEYKKSIVTQFIFYVDIENPVISYGHVNKIAQKAAKKYN